MRVEPNDLIAGVRAKDLRDYFRRLRGRAFVAEDMVRELGVGAEEAAQIARQLHERGLIEDERSPFDDRVWFNLTTNGNQLALAKFTKRFSRATAETLLGDTIARAAAINADDALTHRVTELRVFGSYLSAAEDLGDVDIAFDLAFRHHDKDVIDASIERARLAGASTRSFIEQIGYGESEVVRLLQGGSRRISLHRKDELKQLGVEGKVVFPVA